jgi:hypothetical protein
MNPKVVNFRLPPPDQNSAAVDNYDAGKGEGTQDGEVEPP